MICLKTLHSNEYACQGDWSVHVRVYTNLPEVCLSEETAQKIDIGAISSARSPIPSAKWGLICQNSCYMYLFCKLPQQKGFNFSGPAAFPSLISKSFVMPSMRY